VPAIYHLWHAQDVGTAVSVVGFARTAAVPLVADGCGAMHSGASSKRSRPRYRPAGEPVTAKRIPQGADLDYLAIRAAIEARMHYQKEHGARWVREYFELDAASESILRRKAAADAREMVMATMDVGPRWRR